MLRNIGKKWLIAIFACALILFLGSPSDWLLSDAIGQTSSIRNTKHNFSSLAPSATNPVRAGAGQTEEICVFCHTPHGSLTGAPAPLWNKAWDSGRTYTTYFSSTLDAVTNVKDPLPQPGSESKLCLSCHDGTLAIGSGVSNSPGSGTGRTTTMVGTEACAAPGTTTDTNCIPAGTDGKTRRLGIDLTNDHPIAQTYNSTLATNDGELRSPPYTLTPTLVIGPRSLTSKPKLPLMAGSAVQCNTCHDPHISWPAKTVDGASRDPGKFLRLPRFQQTATPAATHNLTNDQVCISCHDKKGWVGSVHADKTAAAEPYTDTAAAAREFPQATQVWEGGCLNCHDTHGRTGTRRLLRNGLDASSTPAVEEVCYQCHQSSTTSAVTTLATLTATDGVPDIKTQFTGAGKIRMPISDADQRGSGEVHEIVNADFLECRKNLGATSSDTTKFGALATGTVTNSDGFMTIGPNEVNYCNTTVTIGTNDRRHAECSDCHNPHRVLKNKLFNAGIANADATVRTHRPGTTIAGVTNGSLNNLASGPLSGIWGVEPTFATNWLEKPTTFTVKFGQPGTAVDRAQSYLTREYQLCFKCHSNFAYTDDGKYGGAIATAGVASPVDTNGDASGRPRLGSVLGSAGGTPSGTNFMSTYTNQAAEFAVRANDTNTGTDQGASGANLKRSWHPVTYPTGRTLALRGISTNPFRTPFTNVGTQTMYCSDCHGAEGSWTGGSGPNHATVQGPHGSTNSFLLRAPWRAVTGESNLNDLCFNCHNSGTYAGSNDSSSDTGFCCDQKSNHHNYHNSSRTNQDWRCSICHVAIPHGWKNKAFLVNLRDVGPEAGLAAGTLIPTNGTNVYNSPPYYMGAKLRVTTWQASGSWTVGSCFSGESGMNNNCGG